MMQTTLSIKCGITLAIMPLLALALDQDSKIAGANKESGAVISNHLDEYRQQDITNSICNVLLHMQEGTETCVYLFASPQCLLHHGLPWLDLLVHLYRQHLLHLVCIDEAHLFLKFGQLFRQEFHLLKDQLFAHLGSPSSKYLGCLVLVMTTTYTMLQDFEEMVDFSLPQENHVWADATKMKLANIQICFTLHLNLLSLITTFIISILPKGGTPVNNTIMYTNFSSSSANLGDSIKLALDKYSIPCDVIVNNGLLFKEQKFYFSKLFVGTFTSTVEGYHPKFLVAMAGCASAGINCSSLNSMLYHGFPPSIIDLAQMMGCAGNHDTSGLDMDCYYIVSSLDEFCNLLIHIHRGSKQWDPTLPFWPKVSTALSSEELILRQ